MRSYKVKGEDHFIYDLESELPNDVHPIKNWRDGLPGDWVRAEDDAYVQILERKSIGGKDILRTCVGTYTVNGKMDTAERDDRYNLSGKLSANTLRERKKPTKKEVQFASKVVRGMDEVQAYLEVYNAKSKDYAKSRAAILLKTERINTLMNPSKEELTKVFLDQDIDLEFLIKSAKEEVVDSKNGSDRLNALKMLWEAFGVVEKKKITEVAGIFQGFESAQLEEVKRPSLPEYSSHGDETI